GLRRNEALALRWSDIELLMAQLSVSRSLLQLEKGQVEFGQPKTVKARRVIALSPSTVAVLKEHREAQEKLRKALELKLSDNDLVFCHYDGTPYRPDTISHAWRKLAIKTGVNVRLHDARHTHASLMLKQGIHPKIVQERLGHANISTTLDTYSHVLPGLQEAAASRFDDILLPKTDAAVNSR
ncbi:MAG: site-specific integrase, partial [Chloroflexi bacterium]|nr:site-specific integrase [Chloroflexota bacterium]